MASKYDPPKDKKEIFKNRLLYMIKQNSHITYPLVSFEFLMVSLIHLGKNF